MTLPALRAVPPDHPLQDRVRLEEITDLIWTVLRRRIYGRTSRNIHHGVSLEDLLQTALLELLHHRPPGGGDLYALNWEGLAVRIAQRRAIDAVRAAKRVESRRAEPTDVHGPATDAPSTSGPAGGHSIAGLADGSPPLEEPSRPCSWARPGQTAYTEWPTWCSPTASAKSWIASPQRRPKRLSARVCQSRGSGLARSARPLSRSFTQFCRKTKSL